MQSKKPKQIRAKRPKLTNPRAEQRKSERDLRMAKIISRVLDEYKKLTSEDHILSEYEGYSLLLKEFDRLWVEIKKPREIRDVKKSREAAARIGAMALRYINDLTGLC